MGLKYCSYKSAKNSRSNLIQYYDCQVANFLCDGYRYHWNVGVYGYDDSGSLIALSWSDLREFYYTGE